MSTYTDMPTEILEQFVHHMSYDALKNATAVNRKLYHIVRDYLIRRAGVIRKEMGDKVAGFSDQELIERIYHMNGYVNSDTSSIIIKHTLSKQSLFGEDKDIYVWSKGANRIISTTITELGVFSEYQEEWIVDGKLHRFDGPAKIVRGPYHFVETWYHDGDIHRDDGPADIYKHDDDNNVTEDWYYHGQIETWHDASDYVRPDIWYDAKQEM